MPLVNRAAKARGWDRVWREQLRLGMESQIPQEVRAMASPLGIDVDKLFTGDVAGTIEEIAANFGGEIDTTTLVILNSLQNGIQQAVQSIGSGTHAQAIRSASPLLGELARWWNDRRAALKDGFARGGITAQAWSGDRYNSPGMKILDLAVERDMTPRDMEHLGRWAANRVFGPGIGDRAKRRKKIERRIRERHPRVIRNWQKTNDAMKALRHLQKGEEIQITFEVIDAAIENIPIIKEGAAYAQQALDATRGAIDMTARMVQQALGQFTRDLSRRTAAGRRGNQQSGGRGSRRPSSNQNGQQQSGGIGLLLPLLFFL